MARSTKDHYQLLGVARDATREQIKAAYRRRALRLHPDKNPTDPAAAEQFKACSEAYALLSDGDRRIEYDTELLLEAGPAELVTGIVSELLGGRLRRRRPGRRLRYNLELSLEQAMRGTRQRVSFSVVQRCGECGGGGAVPGGTRSCADCAGSGELQRAGLLSLPRSCPACGGRGRRVVVPCKRCDGVGNLEIPREVTVAIPPGARHGDVRVVAGAGEPSVDEDGRPGDLYVRVNVRPHPVFERQGRDLVLELPLSIGTLALGGSVEIPTRDGVARIRIPEGSQSGRLLRVRGQGVAGEDPGDLLVRLAAETPVALGARQVELMEQLERVIPPESSPRREGFVAELARLKAERDGQ